MSYVNKLNQVIVVVMFCLLVALKKSVTENSSTPVEATGVSDKRLEYLSNRYITLFDRFLCVNLQGKFKTILKRFSMGNSSSITNYRFCRS